MQVKKKTLWIFAAVLVIAALGFSTTLVKGETTNKVTGNAVDSAQNSEPGVAGGVQEVTLKYQNYVYVMEPSQLKAGMPVKMTADLDSVRGCMTAVRIPAFGVSKNVRAGDNIIEFTPDKTGTFNIACSMGMGATTFDVVDSNGQTGGYVEQNAETGTQLAAGAGNCGAGGGSGGCGCGGA